MSYSRKTAWALGRQSWVVRSTKGAVPGSVLPNQLSVSTANGVVVPPWKCDVWHPVGKADGTVTHQLLKEALVMEDCAHTLISLGRLARDGACGTTLDIGGAAYLFFPDGSRAPLINAGVLLFPEIDSTWPQRAAMAALSQQPAASTSAATCPHHAPAPRLAGLRV